MKLCLDTNAYVALRTGQPALAELLEQADEVFVPAVVIGELFTGFFMGTRQKQNAKELNTFLNLPGVSVSAVDINVAERYGLLIKDLREQGTPLPTNDIWIAASAFETGARLVSYDKHFSKIPGLTVYSP